MSHINEDDQSTLREMLSHIVIFEILEIDVKFCDRWFCREDVWHIETTSYNIWFNYKTFTPEMFAKMLHKKNNHCNNVCVFDISAYQAQEIFGTSFKSIQFKANCHRLNLRGLNQIINYY